MLNRNFAFGSNSSSAFGSNNNNNNNSSAFGTPANTNNNSTGGGLFGGGTSSFGTNNTPGASTTGFGGFGNSNTSPFGSTNNASSSGGLFGAKPATPASNAFGSSFGNANNTSPFGAASSSFGTPPGQTMAPNGTGMVPFNAYTEKEPPSAKEPNKPPTTLVFQSITAMPEYRDYSFEELRWQDYQKNVKFGNGQTQQPTTMSSPFGQMNNNTSTGGVFGSTNNNSSFGQTNNASSGGLFGKPASTTGGSLFGSGANNTNTGFGTGSSAFGSNNSANNSPFGASSGAFGRTNNSTPSFGQANNAFGSTNSATAAPAFGQSNNTVAKPFGSSFGSTGPTQTGSSLFGGGNSSSTGGGLFGNSANNAGTGATSFGGAFGSNTTTGAANNATTGSTGFGFGANNNSTTAPSNSSPFGGFGQNQAQKTTPSFGQSTSIGSTANPSGGLFGSTAGSNTGSGFGSLNNNSASSGNTGGLFGAKPAATTGTSGFSFGQSNNQPAATGSLLGNNNNSSTTGGGLFGAKPDGQASNSSGGLFGAKPAATTGGLFGSSTTAPSTSTTGFGLLNKPAAATSSPFGASTSNTSGGLFGGNSTVGNNNNSSGGLFGGNSFGSKLGQPATNNTGLGFGNSLQNSQQRVAQIDQQPFGNSPLFQQNQNPNQPMNGGSSLKVLSAPLSTTPVKKKHGGLVSAYKMVPKPLYSPARVSTPGRGRSIRSSDDFDGSQYYDVLEESSNGTKSGGFSPGRSLRKKSSTPDNSMADDSLLKGQQKVNGFSSSADDFIIQSQAFLPKSSVRRLIVDRALRREESSFLDSNSILGGGDKSSENALPALEAATTSTPDVTSRATLDSEPVKVSALTTTNATHTETEKFQRDEDITDENDYWISPNQEKLQHMSLKELRSVKNFRVGRKGVGEVLFVEPVDLSNFTDFMKQIPGRIVVLSNRSCTLYPDEVTKPSSGEELNKKVKISLFGIWPKLKDSGKVVKDPNHPLSKLHTKRLQNAPGTEFISYDPSTGKWVFMADAQR